MLSGAFPQAVAINGSQEELMRMPKYLSLASLLVLLSLVAAACGTPAIPTESAEADAGDMAMSDDDAAMMEDYSDASRAETVIFEVDARGGQFADPELMNPYVPGGLRNQGLHQSMQEPLFILNYQTGEIEPWLGESMIPNETFDEWTLNLRQGVKWSDGEAFNADDVVFTMGLLMENTEMNYAAGLQDWVSEVTKVDDFTVTFNLTRPNPRFQLDNWSVRIWGGPIILPEHIWNGQDPLTFKNYDPAQGWPVFTGPYLLDSVSPTEFSYVRNDDWWGAKVGWKELPEPKKLIWIRSASDETAVNVMAQGGIDSLMDITLGQLQALQAQNPDVITWFDEMPLAWVPDPCSRTFEFNAAIEPWNDPDMRWAINYSIDRDEIVRIAYEGTTLKDRHYFPAYPPLDALVDKAIEAGAWDLDRLFTYDPELTYQILEDKGYAREGDGYWMKDGEDLGVVITTHEGFIEKKRIAQVIVEQLQRSGINAVHRNEAGQTWGDNFRNGNFETRMGWQTCGSVNEPWATMDNFNTRWLVPIGERANDNSWRWSGDNAEQYSALVDQIGSLPMGDPAIEELFLQATALVFEDLPVIPITEAKKIIPFLETYWTNWPTFENDYIHPPTWWQHTHYIIHEIESTGN